MVFVVAVYHSAFCRIHFHGFAFRSDQLIFDPLEMPPIAEDRFAIAAANVEVSKFPFRHFEISDLDLIQIVQPVFRAVFVF
jgi:hypothetical protein